MPLGYNLEILTDELSLLIIALINKINMSS